MAEKRETVTYKGYDITKQNLVIKGETVERYIPYRPDRGGPLKQQATLQEAQKAVDEDIVRRKQAALPR
jgi:hypothetical protein